MTQITTINRLNNRLQRIESEIIAIRQELTELTSQQSQELLADITISSTFVNKKLLREQMKQLFVELSIQGEPVGAETLQKQMREAGLAPNELSQSIVAAREE